MLKFTLKNLGIIVFILEVEEENYFQTKTNSMDPKSILKENTIHLLRN